MKILERSEHLRKICHQTTVSPKRKSGFTLVELVVVIAIIAILAAIAIPVVIGIVDHANETNDKDAANEIDKACITYKTGIVWGIINSADPGNSTQTNLPPPNSSVNLKNTAAKAASVKNVLEYEGIFSSLKGRVESGSFVYDDQGRIFAQIEHPELTNVLELTTTLEDLYY